MAKRNFDEWLDTFTESIADYAYYIDFAKVYTNVEAIKVELNILNSLVGVKDIEQKFEALVSKYPETLKCIPILLAKRETEISAMDADGAYKFSFTEMNYSIEEYKIFMRKTGLFDLLTNHIINNLVDYVTGVETGLDSNGRKNRGGHLMENLVERFIVKAGFEKDENYFKEMYISEIQDKWHVDLSAVSNEGKNEKRFDYVVKTSSSIYLIETNFYTSGGSKLNETARSYKTLTNEIAPLKNIHFVWITDGLGWKSAKGNLRETFDVLDTLYNINDLENGIISTVFK
ncbi:MAG: type II restriction endonuclease [Synergistaceae bacterium]|nr:type II restriction endonuclease [Synergistaceae bacterium]